MNDYPSFTGMTDVLLRAVEQSPSIVVITDTKARIEYVNPAFCHVTGYSFEEAVGQVTSILRTGDTPEKVYVDLWRQLNARKEWRGEFMNRKKNEEKYWEAAAISAIHNEAGKVEHYVKVAEDTTAHTALDFELKTSRERYERVLLATRSFMFSVLQESGRTVRTIYYPGSYEVTGYTREEYEASPHLWLTMIPEEDHADVTAQIERVRRQKITCCIEHRIRHKAGSIRWIKNTSVPTFDSRGNLTGYDGLISDISDLKQALFRQKELMDEVRLMAMLDPLTGLFSRRGFEKEFIRAWQLCQRQGWAIGLLILDVDHFKVFNDVYGHAVGDKVLIEMSRLIVATSRSSDIISRWGGDEIMVILLLAGDEDIQQVAQRLLEAFRHHVFCQGTFDLQVRISIGAVVGRGKEDTPEKLQVKADQALYRAKHQGRDRISF